MAQFNFCKIWQCFKYFRKSENNWSLQWSIGENSFSQMICFDQTVLSCITFDGFLKKMIETKNLVKFEIVTELNRLELQINLTDK